MDQAIDRRGGGHLIAEDPIPVREDQIARDEDGSSLIAFGEEREQNLGLLGTLLDVADIIEDEDGEVIELAQGARQIQIPLRRQELLHEAVSRHEEHGVAAVDKRVADGTERMGLADARQPECQHVRGILEDVALRELVKATHQGRRQAPFIERWRTFFPAAAWTPDATS